MKILFPNQIRELDKYTIIHEPITSIDLMERAAIACTNWIKSHINNRAFLKIFCGTGNNGGDGLAIARLLSEQGYKITCCILTTSHKPALNFTINKKRLKKTSNLTVLQINDFTELPAILKNAIIIDAIFGTGLNKSPSGLAASVISGINKSKLKVISIDMPSGMYADKSSIAEINQIIKATYTLTFESLKPSFLFAENSIFLGEVFILPIGLSKQFIKKCKTNFALIDANQVKSILHTRNPFSHKGNYGHAAIIAGSCGKMGAAVLAAKGCLVSGAGLLTVHIPACGYEIMQTAVPEAMVHCDTNRNKITDSFKTTVFTTLGIGPGMGTSEKTMKALRSILQQFRKPIVLDADALNILSENKQWMKSIPKGSILSPHPKEFERIAAPSSNEFDRNKLQIKFASQYQVYVILKGRYTCIATPEGMCYFNPTGNPGMAKGGSGDVLTGILTGLLAQGYSPLSAAIAGVYIHGLAADIAIEKTGEYSLLASDIIEHTGRAFLKLQQNQF